MAMQSNENVIWKSNRSLMEFIKAGLLIGMVTGLMRMVAHQFHFTQLNSYGSQIDLNIQSVSIRLLSEWLIWVLFTLVVALVIYLIHAGSEWVTIGIITGLVMGGVWSCLILPLIGMSVWPNQFEWRTIVSEICIHAIWGTWLSMTQRYLSKQ